MKKQININFDSMKTWQLMMRFGEKMGCHQLPDRSFHFHGYQFPICARCTGVLLSYPFAIILFFSKRISILGAIVFSLIMLIDWVIQFLNICESTNFRRLCTGIIGGYGVMTLEMYCFYFIYKFLFD